ncbi:MAG: SGNH/GDSL hydrolase family protein [Bacteroidota bacterium]
MKKKRLIRVFLQGLILLLLLELSLRIIFYQQVGREKLAVIETAKNIRRRMNAPDLENVYQHFLLARPDSGNTVNRQIAQESFESNHFEYAPWTEYKNIDYVGKYINTHGLIRATMPDRVSGAHTTAEQTIYFFGGSTMYGVNIADRETIASAFVDLYRDIFPKGVAIKVVNYGLSAHYSYNELMLLTHLIYSGQHPNITIMFDGLNDFLIPTASLRRLPYYYYRLRQASHDHINFKELESINDSTQTLFDDPPGYSIDLLVDTLVNSYLSNMEQIRKLASVNDFSPFFFIQPNPFYHYSNQDHDPICEKRPAPLVTKAYTILEKRAVDTGNCFFLGNMLLNEKGYPFIDRFHYSPGMCRKIAKELVMVVGKKINNMQ